MLVLSGHYGSQKSDSVPLNPEFLVPHGSLLKLLPSTLDW